MNSIKEKDSATESSEIPCPLWRRFCAIVYDSILLGCVVFLAWQPVPLLPNDLYPVVARAIRLGYLITICFLFFGWFWHHGGQTLGMKAWRIKLVPAHPLSQASVSWRMAWIRFISSLLSWVIFGIGYFWSFFHHGKLAWHDIISGTRLIVLTREKNKNRNDADQTG
jgi:uncharacterized RDD family membrane protein YckC